MLIFLFQKWLSNPYGLEDARLGPKGNEKLPLPALVENAQNYLLFSHYEGNTFAIHLPLPNEYIHPSNATSRLIKSYATSITMYYPELNGRFHPSNANLPTCNGYCGGYLRAFVSARQTDARTMDARALDQLRKDRSNGNRPIRFEDLDSAYGFDQRFSISYPVIEAKSNGNKHSMEEYLLKKDQSGNVLYMFKCRPYTPSPSCEVRFNLSSRPELLLEVRFGRHLMSHWEEIIHSVDKKIVSWTPTRIDAAREDGYSGARPH